MNLESKPKYALVIAAAPKNQYQEPDRTVWDNFLTDLFHMKQQPKKTTKIHDNVWLIPLDSDMPFLSALVLRGTDTGIPLKILFLDDGANWIEYPPPPDPPALENVAR